MNEQTDQQLLRAYAERQSEAAFAALVHRYVDLVYSAAFRMVNHDHTAKDVTQNVFFALAQKARQLTDRPTLAGWLHHTARNLAVKTIRSDVRRRAREQEAAVMNELLSTNPDASWEHIAPLLDEALSELSEPERDAVLLRYFKNHDLRTVGATLGISDDAAQKRVSRAVERLREFFAKRGVTVGTGGLAVVISANAVQAAPVGLALTISTAAALTGTTLATTATITATKAIAMTTLQKTIVTATIAVLAGAGIYEARQVSQLREQKRTLQRQQAERDQQLQRERDDATNQVAWLTDELAKETNSNLELLKLRGEVGALGRQLESQRAQAVQLPATSSEPGTARLAPNAYISKNQLTNAGFDTPEAALQTYMHAILSGNYDQVVSAFSASTPPPDFTNDPQQREQFEKATGEASASFLGQQILAKKSVGDDRVDLEVLVFQEGKFPDTTIQRMVKEGGNWKFAGSYGVSPSSGSDNQIQLFAPSASQ